MNQRVMPDVGSRLRSLRQQRGLSLRALGELCGLSPNTISLTERGSTSPSVSTLNRLAVALGVPTTYFLTDPAEKEKVILTRADLRSQFRGTSVVLESLASGMEEQAWKPFVVSLGPGASNGRRVMSHAGHELVFCLEGELECEIDGERYELLPGDALLFSAHLPHGWRNSDSSHSEFVLLMTDQDDKHQSIDQHLPP